MDPVLDGFAEAWKRRLASEAAAKRSHAQEARERLPKAVKLLREADAKKAVLFGSLARGELGAESDVDLCVQGVGPEMLDGLRDALESLFGRRVDIVRWEMAPEHWRRHIEDTGEVLA